MLILVRHLRKTFIPKVETRQNRAVPFSGLQMGRAPRLDQNPGKIGKVIQVMSKAFLNNTKWMVYIYIYIYKHLYIHVYINRNAWALPRRCSVEGRHSQSNVVATLHSIGKINKSIREY